jgi:hypothetical protein
MPENAAFGLTLCGCDLCWCLAALSDRIFLYEIGLSGLPGKRKQL